MQGLDYFLGRTTIIKTVEMLDIVWKKRNAWHPRGETSYPDL
jgi:hypothetical protein